jgi:ribosome-associated translation inhibitor RaiA
VIKKIVGQYARRMSDTVPGFEGLRVALEEEGHGSIAIHAHVRVNEHESIGDAHEHNIFVALDTALKRAESVMRKHHDKEQEL